MLVEQEVKQLAIDWYKLLDVHAPLEEVLPLLEDENLEMKFPEATIKGQEQFKSWYETVTHKFFDEVHELKEVQVTLNGNRADVKLVVNWQAHVWNPPEAKSKWLGFDADQTWIVALSVTGKPVIETYIVNALIPMEGSAAL